MMKSILALTVAGLLASTAVVAQEKMGAPAAAPAASAPAAAPAGEQPAKKTPTHHRKKGRKTIAKANAAKSAPDTKSPAPSSDMKK